MTEVVHLDDVRRRRAVKYGTIVVGDSDWEGRSSFVHYVDENHPELSHAVKKEGLKVGWYASFDGYWYFMEVFKTKEEAAKAAS
jgi:hypothetical protein